MISRQVAYNYNLISTGIDLNKYSVLNGYLVKKNPASVDPKIRLCVKEIFESLHNAAMHARTWQEKEQAIYALRSFAFGPAARLDRVFFDRSICTKSIQNILSPKLHKLRGEKQYFPKSQERRLQAKIAKAELAFYLGINPIPNTKGLSGSSIFQDVKGKNVALLKPKDMSCSSLIKKLTKFLIKYMRVYPQGHFLRNKETLPTVYADVGSWVASQFFGIQQVPPTTRVRFKRPDGYVIDGAFMLWERHAEHSHSLLSCSHPTREELTLFQKMAILDYFLGNLDRHSDNWLIKKDEKGRLKHIILIDNSATFIDKSIKKRFSHTFARQFQYAWRHHPFARYPLTNEALATLSLFTKKNAKIFLAVLHQELMALGMPKKEIKSFMSHKMQRLLMQRVKVLSSLIHTPKVSLKKLGALSTQEAITSWLGK